VTSFSYITLGEKKALMAALTSGGDQGFLAAAQSIELTEWRLAWDMTIQAGRIVRCIACGHWVAHYAMSRAGDICLACENEEKQRC
jgi:hypothetical protein